MLIALMLALLVTAPVFASSQATSYIGQADDTVNLTWSVEPSDQYTFTFVQATPFIFYNSCLTTNTTYIVNFSVIVDT